MKKIIIFPGLIRKISTLVDGSIKITLETRELSPDDAANVFAFRNVEGHIAIKESDFSSDDLEKLPDMSLSPSPRKQKSESQRLRAVLYILWQKTHSTMSSEEFYKMMMERIISHYKNKLEEI